MVHGDERLSTRPVSGQSENVSSQVSENFVGECIDVAARLLGGFEPEAVLPGPPLPQ